MLWSIGKDSTALLWMARKAFLGRVPFPMVLLETFMELPEVYEFRDELIEKWQLEYFAQICPPESEVDQTLPPATRAAARKTEGLRTMLREQKFDAVIVGIRRDEQAMRAKERVFSPRRIDGTWDVKEQPPEFWATTRRAYRTGRTCACIRSCRDGTRHLGVHAAREHPYVPLYLARNGKRYRSLGEKNITVPIESNAATIEEIIEELRATRVPERAGRTMDNESEASFERLRAGGYM